MNILHLMTSPRGGASNSNKLSNAIVNRLTEIYPGSSVKTQDLAQSPLPHLDQTTITSFFTPEEQLTPEIVQSLKLSDDTIADINEADVIVIGTGMYNFSIPSTLKAWIDHIVRARKTFRYSEAGIEGLIKNKKLYLAIAAGGIYSEGFMKEFDFTENYLRAVFGFLGMTDITVFRVEGLNLPGVEPQAMADTYGQIEQFAF